jgi:hypothetical protein
MGIAIFTKILEFITGGVGEKIVDAISSRLPDRLSQDEKNAIKLAAAWEVKQQELELIRLAQAEQEQADQRIRDLEGTAGDLQHFGIIGNLLMLLRGSQRPIWGFAVMYGDFMVFSGRWQLSHMQQLLPLGNGSSISLESVFWLINCLVLGFLFGERAMKNVLPMLIQGKKG